MKFASFEYEGRNGYGLVRDETVIDLGARFADAPDLKSLIDSPRWADLEAATQNFDADYALSDLVFNPVIPNPPRIFCIGLNYHSHREETGRAPTGHPVIFVRVSESQTGHERPILCPGVSEELDFEGELAVIVGRGGRYIDEKEALSHVAGYACYNDATVRDWQRHTHQFTPGKNFPATGAFGPFLVTADEAPEVGKLAIETRLNSEIMQSATLDQLIFSVERLIAYISAFTPLKAGDVICTGTPGGVGFKRTPPRFMAPGDAVEVEIPGIGRLCNTIEQDALRPAEPF